MSRVVKECFGSVISSLAKMRECQRCELLEECRAINWTEPAAATLTEITGRSKKELGAKGLQLQLTGRVSDRARTELQSLGWAVQERVSGGSPSGNEAPAGDPREG